MCSVATGLVPSPACIDGSPTFSPPKTGAYPVHPGCVWTPLLPLGVMPPDWTWITSRLGSGHRAWCATGPRPHYRCLQAQLWGRAGAQHSSPRVLAPVDTRIGADAWPSATSAWKWGMGRPGGEEVLLHPGQEHKSDKFSQNSRNFIPAGKPRWGWTSPYPHEDLLYRKAAWLLLAPWGLCFFGCLLKPSCCSLDLASVPSLLSTERISFQHLHI